MANCCSNCNIQFTEDDTCHKLIDSERVSLVQALAAVYGYPLGSEACDKRVWRDGDDCGCCDTCAKLITQLYTTYLKLRRLADTQSYLSKGVVQIQDCVRKAFGNSLANKERPSSSNSEDAEPFLPFVKRENNPTNSEPEENLNDEDEYHPNDDGGDWNDDDDEEEEENAQPVTRLNKGKRCLKGDTSEGSASDQPQKKVRTNKDLLQEPGSSSAQSWENSVCKCKKTDCNCVCYCTQCSITFPETMQLSKHIVSEHDDYKDASHKRTMTCPRCVASDIHTKNIYVNYYELKSHLAMVHKETVNLCTKCGKSFSAECHLISHRKKVHNKSDEDNPPSLDIEPGEIRSQDVLEFICLHCCVDFTSEFELNKHFLQHNDVKPKFGCAKCPKRFFRHDSLRRHVPVHSWKDLNSCQDCGKQFERQDHLDRHVIAVHDPKHKPIKRSPRPPRTPPKPKKSSPSLPPIQPKPPAPSPIKFEPKLLDTPCQYCSKLECTCICVCTVCSFQFESSAALAGHIKTIHGDVDTSVHKRTLTCPFCLTADPQTKSIFTNYDELKSHAQKDHKESINLCTLCGKSFQNYDYLRAHRQAPCQSSEARDESEPEPGEIPDPQDIFQCLHCNVTFPRKHNLTKHLLLHNNVQPAFGCLVCQKTVFRQDSLRRHLQVHTSKDPVSCLECGKTFERQDHLNRHMTTVHDPNPQIKTDTKSLSCSTCNKVFTRLCYLNIHKRHQACSPKVYVCHLCGKPFKDAHALWQHGIFHKPERPFCCSICGMTFKRRNHLADHEKRHEPNMPRPFVCQEESCKKTFTREKDLRKHGLVHSGVKPFTCEICGRAYQTNFNLKQHFIQIHQKEKEKEERISM